MAHKKAGGSSRNGRDSAGRRLGVKKFGGEAVLANPGGDSQRIARDALAAADPDAVIVVPCGFDLQRAQQAMAELPPVACIVPKAVLA